MNLKLDQFLILLLYSEIRQISWSLSSSLSAHVSSPFASNLHNNKLAKDVWF